jgi:hypothetical protein
MTTLASTPDPPAEQSMQVALSVHRRVAVKGSGGVSATVFVVARRGQVWVSIMPPFTWEAILEPIKIDELIHTLRLAQEDAKKLAAAHEKRTSLMKQPGRPATTDRQPRHPAPSSRT